MQLGSHHIHYVLSFKQKGRIVNHILMRLKLSMQLVACGFLLEWNVLGVSSSVNDMSAKHAQIFVGKGG